MRFQAQVLVFLIGILASLTSVAQEPHKLTLNLPAEIKPLLKKEMLAIEKGMQDLVSAMAKGDWAKTAEIGKQIQASYLMKQSLTVEQMQHLHHSLPEQFIRLDHSFHHYAGMLAHAAEVKNMDVMSFYFYKMNDSCMQCHAHYAQEQFPAFSTARENHPKHQH